MCFDRTPKNLFVFLETDISKSVLFSSEDGLYTEMFIESNPCECGTVVTHWTTDLKIPPGRSRIQPRVNFSFGRLKLFTLTGTLHWAGNGD